MINHVIGFHPVIFSSLNPHSAVLSVLHKASQVHKASLSLLKYLSSTLSNYLHFFLRFFLSLLRLDALHSPC